MQKKGEVYKTDIIFKNEKHLKTVINNMANLKNQSLNENNPIINIKLPNGFYLHAIMSLFQ